MKFLTFMLTLFTFTALSSQAFADNATISCSSNNHSYKTCSVNGFVNDAQVSNQISETVCIEGRNWGFGENYIWVDDGCRAQFSVQYSRRNGRIDRPDNRRDGRGRDRRDRDRRDRGQIDNLTCRSYNFGYSTCSADGYILNARLTSIMSESGCVEGYSWGYGSDYIWVDKGCRARFQLRVSSRF